VCLCYVPVANLVGPRLVIFFCQMDGSCSLGSPATCSPCVCGAPCNIPVTGIIGVCHTQGSCQAVTDTAPNCLVLNHAGSVGPVGVIANPTVASCPTYKCLTPDCPADNQVTPTASTGCALCPQCACTCGAPCNIPATGAVGVCHAKGLCQEVTATPPVCKTLAVKANANVAVSSNLLLMGSAAEATNTLGDSSARACPACAAVKCAKTLQYTPATGVNGCPPCLQCRACPKFRCVLPQCPVEQRMTTHNANGCPTCPSCNPDKFGQGCPTLKCTPPPCNVDHQETLKANGCNQCPTCKTAPPTTQPPSQPPSSLCVPEVCPTLNCHGQPSEMGYQPNGCPGCPYCIIFT